MICRNGGYGSHAFAEDTQNDGWEEAGCGQPEGKRNDLADESRWIDSENPGDDDGDDDDRPSHTQPLRFVGIRPEDSEIEIVGDAGRDHQQEAAGG